MKKIIPFFILAASFAFIACSEDEIKTYDGRNFIYFSDDKVNTVVVWDTLQTYNFFFNPGVEETTLYIKVKAGGMIPNEDRTFIVDVKSENATLGVDYSVEREQIMPAGKSTAEIAVKLFKTAELEGNTYTLDFTLEPNENFTNDLPVVYHKQDTISRQHFRVKFLAELDTPPLWSMREFIIGYWSIEKFNELNRICGITIENWLSDKTDPKSVSVNFNNYCIVFANYLNSRIATGKDTAIKDLHKDSDRGYMTIIGGQMGIPAVTIPTIFPDADGWKGNQNN
ncbi:DUF4843 domain-containing protein [Bacteroides sp. 224]|uniref:DUF4843 domain-containing protein n=1 Tax=Bacteroides sp. 224 TaxID=2302936 RepID=UPI0013D74731|nr:DUF4843 domain-containing protein [Bacteroides sp. 224]NDV64983.1 DUF4843 domain-containing protein [Bacteroides sp. 224]